MDSSNLATLLPVFLLLALGMFLIPIAIFGFGGGFTVPASLGGGESGGVNWNALGFVLFVVVSAPLGFKKALDYLDSAPPTRR